MTTQPMTPAELSHRAISILIRELGPADARRFINQFTTGHGDYTAERDQLLAGVTLDQIVAEIKQRKG